MPENDRELEQNRLYRILPPDLKKDLSDFCMTMMTDGLKALGKDEEVAVLELTELLAKRV